MPFLHSYPTMDAIQDLPISGIHLLLWYQKCKIEVAMAHLSQLVADEWPQSWHHNLWAEWVSRLFIFGKYCC